MYYTIPSNSNLRELRPIENLKKGDIMIVSFLYCSMLQKEKQFLQFSKNLVKSLNANGHNSQATDNCITQMMLT